MFQLTAVPFSNNLFRLCEIGGAVQRRLASGRWAAYVTLQDLGNLGELIAAIATIATLAYLALQIRQNAKSVQGSTAQSLMQLEVSTFALIAQHASIYRRGSENIEDLSPDEAVVFEQLVSAVISLMVTGFFQFQNGLLPSFDEYLADWEKIYLKQPGFQAVWAKIRHGYPEELCQCLDEVGKTASARRPTSQ